MSDDFNLFDGGGEMEAEDREEAEFLDDLIERELAGFAAGGGIGSGGIGSLITSWGDDFDVE